MISEIEKRIKEIDEIGTYLSPKGVLTNLLCHLSTLEVKEVDLDNELDFIKDAYYYFTSDERSSMKKVARHFFELGLKAQKGGYYD